MFRNWDNLASVLKWNGYRTAVIGKLHVNPPSALPLDYLQKNDSRAAPVLDEAASRTVSSISPLGRPPTT